jgi:serine/threonine protein kinase
VDQPDDRRGHDPSFEPGTAVGTYRLEAFVAAGGMAEVYRARHTKLDKVVAIKFLDREHARRPPVVARFLREGRFASQIRHPNVVEVTDVDEHDGLPYLVMEYLEGQTLSEVIREQGRLEPEAIADIMLPVCAAVAAAHARGVIHRDLKPGNVFLSETDIGEVAPKVLDFGISKSVEEDPASALTTSASFLGTPIYLSPEQAAGEDGTTASDQYSLGVMLYELATGRRPYDTNQKFIRLLNAISKGEFDPPRVHHEELSEQLERTIMRAMSLEPGDRFPTVLELATVLLRIANERTRTLWQPRLAKQGEEKKATSDEQLPKVAGDAVTELATATTVTRVGSKADEPEPKSKPRGVIYLAVAAVVALVIWQLVPDETPASPNSPATSAPVPASSFQVAVVVEPPSAELVLDGTTRGSGRLDLKLPLDGRAHDLEVRAEGYVTQRFSFRDAPPPQRVSLDRVPSAPSTPTASADGSTAATASASATAAATPPPKRPTSTRPVAPKATATAAPAPTYSAHPDNIDPWNE